MSDEPDAAEHARGENVSTPSCLPPEVIVMVCNAIQSYADLKRMRLVNHLFETCASPELFRYVLVDVAPFEARVNLLLLELLASSRHATHIKTLKLYHVIDEAENRELPASGPSRGFTDNNQTPDADERFPGGELVAVSLKSSLQKLLSLRSFQLSFINRGTPKDLAFIMHIVDWSAILKHVRLPSHLCGFHLGIRSGLEDTVDDERMWVQARNDNLYEVLRNASKIRYLQLYMNPRLDFPGPRIENGLQALESVDLWRGKCAAGDLCKFIRDRPAALRTVNLLEFDLSEGSWKDVFEVFQNLSSIEAWSLERLGYTSAHANIVNTSSMFSYGDILEGHLPGDADACWHFLSEALPKILSWVSDDDESETARKRASKFVTRFRHLGERKPAPDSEDLTDRLWYGNAFSSTEA